MSIAKEHALMWLDTETTGLNPHKDQLLEIGVIVTSMDGEEVIYQRSTVLYHEALTITQDMLAAVRMHMANGLLDECLDYGKSTSHEDAYARYYHELASLTDRYVLHPAGSNVQFDLAFVDAHAPGKYHHGGNSDRGFWEYLAHYRRFDLTALRLLWQTAGVRYEPGIDTDHRVQTCLLRDLDEYRAMLEQFRDAMAPAQMGETS